MEKIDKIINDLTLEEKATLLTGKIFWETHSIDRHGVNSMFLADGPHGLRKQSGSADHLGIAVSDTAVCFPLACATACSFDEEMSYKMGESCGEEARAGKVAILLSPSNNIKRSPLCGRNFEYYSEDPLLCGKIASALIQGIESRGVAANIKPFAVNNQEFQRMTIDAVVDEQALRELYLPPYEIPIREGKVKSLMTSYNKINGVYTTEAKRFLTDIIREEWGFDGYILTDWGSNDILHRSVTAGLDLEMPGTGDVGPKNIVKAYKDGKMTLDSIDRAVRAFLTIYYRTEEAMNSDSNYNLDVAHEIALEVAEGCPVLLKNDRDVLPITAEKHKEVAVIGEFAKKPRYQGKGSSKVNSHRVDCLWDALKVEKTDINFTYSQGYSAKTDVANPSMIAEARAKAKNANAVVLMVGLTPDFESEGFDRTHLNMPCSHLDLIDAVCEVNENVSVVLSNGGVVKLPFADQVPAILEGYLLGEAGGRALANILLGKVSPSGRLAESIIKHERQDPAYGNFPGGENGQVHYKESIYIGYRAHQKWGNTVTFPFGHGLSYTTFDYSNLAVSPNSKGYFSVSVDVTNTGAADGKEVVQLYISEKNPIAKRPVRELKAFDKVYLTVGETRTVSFDLDKRSFAYYNTDLLDWHINAGEFGIEIGKSCEEIVLEKIVDVASEVFIDKSPSLTFVDIHKPEDSKLEGIIHRNTRMEELEFHPLGKLLYNKTMKGADDVEQAETDEDLEECVIPAEAIRQMIRDLPLRNLTMFAKENLSESAINFLIKVLNMTRKDKELGNFIHLFTKNK